MARRLFEGPFHSSFQACLYVPPQGWARWLPTARFDEHRLFRNTMSLACALGEQRKLPSPPILYFAEPSSTGAVRFHALGEHRKPSALTSLLLRSDTGRGSMSHHPLRQEVFGDTTE